MNWADQHLEYHRQREADVMRSARRADVFAAFVARGEPASTRSRRSNLLRVWRGRRRHVRPALEHEVS